MVVPQEAGEDETNPNRWGYGGLEKHWGELGWKQCAVGKQQSPINIDATYWRSFWASPWSKRFREWLSPRQVRG